MAVARNLEVSFADQAGKEVTKHVAKWLTAHMDSSVLKLKMGKLGLGFNRTQYDLKRMI